MGNRGQQKPLRMAEVFARAKTVVLSDGTLMLVARIVEDRDGATLAILEDGGCVGYAFEEWYRVSLAFHGDLAEFTVDDAEPLIEVERFQS